MVDVNMDDVQEFFLKAMVAGYAGGGERIDIPEMPGYKAIPFEDGDFRLLDQWSSTPDSNYSSGMTIIWYQNVPVWAMHYGGWYKDEAIPCLKAALYEAYSNGVFNGGRGPERHGLGTFMYRNNVERCRGHRTFDFSGEERVTDLDNLHVFGTHWYRGMHLLPRTS